jgi:hypothetical protein
VPSVPLCAEEPSSSDLLPAYNPGTSRPGTPRMLSAMVVENHFT